MVMRRARFLCGTFIIAALLIIARLYFVQIVHGAEYGRQAITQYQETSPDTAERGSIFFTTKDGDLVSAAVMQTGWRIAINPGQLKDPAAAYAALSAIVPIDRTAFMASAAKTSDPYEEIALRVVDSQASVVRAKKIPGVMLVADQWRAYPGGDLAAQALGFVGYAQDGATKTGLYGLEKFYNGTLTQTSSGLYVNPFAELFANLSSALSTDPAAHEGSIVTSIEPKVQQELQLVLAQVMQEYTPVQSGGIIMDPRTGDIIAIGADPSFDPNTYNTASDASVYTDPMVQGRYELGSIMKPLTMAAAIDSGAVTASTTYNDTGCITRSTYKICNYDLKARGIIPMQQILSQSLNVGASFLADTMGHPMQTKYMNLYGFGQKTGIDLPGEVAGDLSPLGSGRGPDANYDTAAFGQGVSISPIEMVRALSSLANEGVLPSPHVVTAIKYDSGVTRSVTVPPGVQVLKPTSAETVTNMLITVFDDALVNGKLKMDHYTVAAKTGTAQLPAPGGGYLPGNVFLHSFFGYFPAHDPKFIIFLFAIKPHGVEYASASLAQPFDDLAKFLINYYNVPPDR